MMEENRRSQVELLYRDLAMLLDEVKRLNEENNRLNNQNNMYKYMHEQRLAECNRLRKLNNRLYSELFKKSMV